MTFLRGAPADLQERLDAVEAVSVRPDGRTITGEDKSGFVMRRGSGLWWRDADPEKPDLHIADPFEVVAETRGADGDNWGLLLLWRDHDHRSHEWALPRSMLAGDGSEYRRVLLDRGLYVAPGRKARDLLTSYLASCRVDSRARAVSRVGWHDHVFILPDATYGDAGGERILLQTAAVLDHAFRVRGTLADWRDYIGGYCASNSRLALAVSAALAAPLIHLTGGEGGGFHLVGPSSIGKSTTLYVAASVWGGGGVRGYLRQWRATDNGLEAVAVAHCDALLCLDELSQIDAKSAGHAAYMLANGGGKSRAGRSGDGRPTAEWRCLFLSTGEIGIADKVAEDNRRRVTAGQQVRVVDIPADAGVGLGLFEHLHRLASARQLADHLRRAAAEYYGTLSRCWLQFVAANIDTVAADLAIAREAFCYSHVPKDADGQVARVAARFGLVAAAGELAIAAGILPWSEGEAERGASACFRAWLAGRGGTGKSELRDGIAAVRRFIEQHGEARFSPWQKAENDESRTINRAGFRRHGNDGLEFLILPETWRSEVCAGFDASALARKLVQRGVIKPGADGKPQRSERLPGMSGTARCYVLRAEALFGGSAGGADE
jgi:putative DNA primase/helicase